MKDWTYGYVSNIGYTYGYYSELNTLRIRLSFLNAGIAPPAIGTACELGFGQGLSTNMHASATVVKWYGTDFNPSQASFAQELEESCQSGAQLFDEAFDQFCTRSDLPDFDFICLHGIWSWISDANRQIIVEFIRRKLKVGGVLYISYNTQPGWAAMIPMRDLLNLHTEVMGSIGDGIVNRIDGALSFVEQLLSVNPAFTKFNPQVIDRLKLIKSQDRHYIAHEFFNKDWRPMAFAEVATMLKTAKVDWVCSANNIETVDALNLSKEQSDFLTAISDPVFKQTVRDFCVNQQFRKDFWVKGVRTLSAMEKAEALRGEKVILGQIRENISLKINEVLLKEEIYAPILDLMTDFKVRTIGQIEEELKSSMVGKAINFGQLQQAIVLLSGTCAILPAQDDYVAQKLKHQTDKLNINLMLKSRTTSAIQNLSSPVTGGGVPVTRFHQLFLLAIKNGEKNSSAWAKFAWSILDAQKQRIIKDGKPLENVEDNILELEWQAEEFNEKYLPLLRALLIA